MSSKRSPSGSGRSRKRAPTRSKPVVVRSRGSKDGSRSSRRTTRRSAIQPPESQSWVLAEVATWLGAIALGLSITATLAWFRAQRDVAAYLVSDREVVQSTVWSAPMMIREGLPLHPEAFESDLLAAGYERVDHLLDSQNAVGDGVGVFSFQEGTFDIWTALPQPLPGIRVDEGRVRIVVDDGVVVDINRESGVTLPPTVLGVIGDVDTAREKVELDELSRWVEPALLSMEDTRFRQHNGIDPIGILRALFTNATSRQQQGGSTLTQQLAKNLFLSRERTLRRKIREVFFAAALEAQLSKDELLELYLGEIYLGQMGGLPLHGIKQAARAWFGKSVGSLELHETALIVGVIPAPNAYSPVRHPDAALDRRNVVLHRMHELGHIDPTQLQAATEKGLALSGLEPSRIRRAPYAVDAAVERVEQELGEGTVSKGLQIYTSVHPLWQRAAEQAVALGMTELDADYPKAADAQVAMVAVRVSDGSVVAMVGGRNYAESAYNRATDANRQVGSTIKPLTVVKALYDQKVTPATPLADEPQTFDFGTETWAPKNYDGKYEGQVTLRRALEASRNIPMVHLARAVGMSRLGQFFKSAGLSQATSFPSAALGSFAASPLEMAGAYTIFDKGIAHEPEVVSLVLGQDGEILWNPVPVARALVDDRAAAQAMDLLKGVITSGTGARARGLGVMEHAGGKTGTTDDYRDAWFVGLTRELSVAVWVGRDRDTLGLSGSRAALPTWAHFIADSGAQSLPFVIPEGLERTKICVSSGQRARDACPNVLNELFVVGTAPKEKCDEHGAAPGLRRVFDKIGNLFRRKDRRRGDKEGTEVLGRDEPEPARVRKRSREPAPQR